MNRESTSSRIYLYLQDRYNQRTPILIKDIYTSFPDLSGGTIRSVIKRLCDKQRIIKISKGVYALPNEDSFLKKATVYTSDVVKEKYIQKANEIIGYVTGLSFANQLGLTTQTASVDFVISNNVSSKKRQIKLNKNRLYVNAPRITVTRSNYKLLQVLDLLNDFEKFSELDMKDATQKILNYLSDVKVTAQSIDEIVSKYPLEAQVRFYKMGAHYAVASK